MITKSEWVDWKQHPVTKEYIGALLQRLEDYKMAWLRKEFGDDTNQMFIILGKAQGVEEVIDFALREMGTQLMENIPDAD